MHKRLFFILLVVMVTLACNSDNKKVRFGSPDYSDINKENFSRDVWQKPGTVIESLGDISEKVIADIGAGTGYFTFRMALNAKKVIAIDIDPDMINLIEAFKLNLPNDLSSKIETRLATPSQPNIKDGEVDIVVLINTASYIKDKLSYFKKVFNKLPAEGKVMIVDYKKSKLPISLEQGEYQITSEVFSTLLQNAGFVSSTIDDSSLEYQYIIIAQKG